MKLGYASPRYAASFAAIGDVLTLPRSGTWVVSRAIRGGHFDVAGLYPFSVCAKWQDLTADVDYLRDLGAVSWVLVSDPFAQEEVSRCLKGWDVFRPFKTHFWVDLQSNWRALRKKNTRNSCNKALREHTVDVVSWPDSAHFGNEFWALYRASSRRRDFGQASRMSLEMITGQLAVPGCVLVVARRSGVCVGMMICYAQHDTGYLHLLGLDDQALTHGTSYALIYRGLESLEERGVRRASLGGAAGTVDDPSDGLYRFKRRWSRKVTETMLAGVVLDPHRYSELAGRSPRGDFFPAYRDPSSELAD